MDFSDRLIYRGWRSSSGWSNRIVLAEDANFIQYPVIAADSIGRVGVGYAKHYVCACYDAHIFYRECAAGDCSNLALWSVALEVSTATSLAPDLTFDSLGNAHFVWQGYLNYNKSVFYSMRVAAAPTWTAPESLANLPNQINLPITPRVAAGSLDNRFVVWSDNVANYTSPQAYYRQWNGTAWSAEAAIAGSANGWSEDWASLLLDGTNTAHLLWSGINQEIFYSTTGSTSVTAPLISIQVTDSANNIVTSFNTNDEGWYEQNPITVTVTVTNPSTTVMNAVIPITFGSPNDTTRFYLWSQEQAPTCQGQTTPYNESDVSHVGYTASCAVPLNPSQTRSLHWGLWMQPSRAGQFDLSAQMLAGTYSGSDHKTLAVELAQIHPFALIPGFGGTQQFGTDKFYKPLLETLKRMGYENDQTLFTDLTYEPLQSVVMTGEQLAAKMEEWETKASQVEWVYHDQNGRIPTDLLGHSLGVPVIRSYVQLTPLDDFKPVSRLLLVGGPNKGTPVTYLAREGLYAGGIFSLLIGPGLIYKSIECGLYDPQTYIQPLDEVRYRTLHKYECGMHSIAELLPTSDADTSPYLKDRSGSTFPYPVPPGSPNGRQHNPLLESGPSDSINDPWWLPENPNPNTHYYDLNSSVQQDLADRGISMNQIHIFYNGALPTHQTYIVDSPNPASLLWRNGEWSKDAGDVEQPNSGDETIPEYSAVASDLWQGLQGQHDLFVPETPDPNARPEKHTNLPVYPESQQAIGTLLSGNKPPFTSPLGLLNDIVQSEGTFPGSSSQNNSTLVIYGIGDIELLMTDPLGRRIGVDPVTGQRVDETPNALYFHPAGKAAEIVVFGPSSGNYVVLATGVTNGEYKLLPLLTRAQETIPVFYQTGIIQEGETIPATVVVP